MLTPCLCHEVHVPILRVLQLLLVQLHRQLPDLHRVPYQSDSQPLPEEPSELPSKQQIYSFL